MWKGWNFEGEYLVSPNNDRYTERSIIACTFIRQMQAHGCLLDICHHRIELPNDSVVKRNDVNRHFSLFTTRAHL